MYIVRTIHIYVLVCSLVICPPIRLSGNLSVSIVQYLRRGPPGGRKIILGALADHYFYHTILL